MTRPFDAVKLVFNPNSTGNAQERAEELAKELAERAPDLPVDLVPTQHAGHGREIARDAARGGCPLVVSVSGDGGYNDVVNGLMEAGSSAFAAVLAAGTRTTTGASPGSGRSPTRSSRVTCRGSTCCG